MDIRNLHLPDRIEWDKAEATGSFGTLVVSALERGFGRTIGNSLRRVLLSSLRGAAPVSVTIDGALHEFTALSGVVQDVPDIILSIKSLDVSLEGDEPALIKLDLEGPASATSADLVLDDRITLHGDPVPVVDVSEGGSISMEIVVESGRGYVTVDDWLKMGRGKEIGEILLDSWFGPVKNVDFEVESARVGDRTDFDRLIMEISTNGTITPEDAVRESCDILIRHLRLITGEDVPGEADEAAAEEEEPAEELVDMPLTEAGLPPRLVNCLAAGGIDTLSQLVSRTPRELLSLRNFGQAALKGVVECLSGHGLVLAEEEENDG